MNTDERIIASRRGQLLVQSVAVLVAAIGTGLALQSWSVLRSSPLGALGDSLGLPVIALVVTALGLWIAIALVKDSWRHRVVLGPSGLTIHDSLGRYTVPYSGLASAQAIPLGGVVLAFREREQWLAGAAGSADVRRRTSDVLRGTYGADVLISKKQLAIDADEFLALLRQRAPAIKGEGAVRHST